MGHDIAAELESLRREVAELRARLEPDSTHGGGVSRRHLLRMAPAAALGGAMALVAGAAPASAAAGDPVLQGADNTFGGTTSLTGGTGDAPALEVNGGGLVDRLSVGPFPLSEGDTLFQVAPQPAPEADPLPTSPTMGVSGFQVNGPDRHMGSTALQVEAVGPAAAMTVDIADGFNKPDGPDGNTIQYPGTGIQVRSSRSTAIGVQVTDGGTDSDAVTIEYAGTSRAFFAVSSSPTNINGTVTGVNEGHGIGVWGEQRGDAVSGYGVVGVAGALGRGAQFQGGAAAVRLVPATGATHPTSGKVGDVYVDRSARFWFCTHASSGSTPATWRQVAFV